jgi:hypothetical protein
MCIIIDNLFLEINRGYELISPLESSTLTIYCSLEKYLNFVDQTIF